MLLKKIQLILEDRDKVFYKKRKRKKSITHKNPIKTYSLDQINSAKMIYNFNPGTYVNSIELGHAKHDIFRNLLVLLLITISKHTFDS